MKIILVLLIIFSAAFCDDCKIPEELLETEDLCWTEEVEVVDRIVQRSKSVLNFARRKLGMAVNEENEKQKCSYYFCILRQLHLLNANDYPSYDAINEWSKKYVIYFQAVELIQQLDKCNSALSNSTMRETHFHADLVDEETETNTTTEKPSTEQSTCDISSEFINCLSKQKECPVFRFP